MKEWRNEGMKEWMTEWLNDWMTDWMTEWLNDWMTEWLNDWKSIATLHTLLTSQPLWNEVSIAVRPEWLLDPRTSTRRLKQVNSIYWGEDFTRTNQGHWTCVSKALKEGQHADCPSNLVWWLVGSLTASPPKQTCKTLGTGWLTGFK